MVTPDRIRLTGLLRKKPRKRGFFYGWYAIRRRLVGLTVAAAGGASLDPVSTAARQSAHVMGPPPPIGRVSPDLA